MQVLGINTGHDASVALVRDGIFVEVVNEERFSRYKNHHGFPNRSVAYIKKKYQIDSFGRVVLVSANGRYDTPLFGDKENEALRKRTGEPLFIKAVFFKLGLLQVWRNVRYWFHIRFKQPALRKEINGLIRKHFPTEEIIHMDHHLAHAWSALAFTEQPEEALIITLDGEGDGLCGSVNRYKNNGLCQEIAIPAGVGIGTLYGKVTEFLGMRRNEHEFKVMGLAPYAKSDAAETFLAHLRSLISFSPKSLSFSTPFHMQYAKYFFMSKTFSNYRFEALASGIQKFTEELVTQFLKAILDEYPSKHVCVGGGVFMNIKLNQVIQRNFPDIDLAFTPSCGDDSLSIGAAKYGYDTAVNGYTKRIETLYLGSEYTDEEIGTTLKEFSDRDFEIRHFLTDSEIEAEVSRLLAEGHIVARFAGRMEWGSRALGNRSILANPSDPRIIRKINEAIKNRDFWMPFAPTILDEVADEYLMEPKASPFMMVGFETTPLAREQIPAALHQYDFSCRPQILKKDDNPEFHHLVSLFKKRTGIGAVLNTSFNLHGSPIVEDPKTAITTFTQCGLTHLAIGNYLLVKV